VEVEFEEQKRLWTSSMCEESAAVKGSQRTVEYSKRGRTKERKRERAI